MDLTLCPAEDTFFKAGSVTLPRDVLSDALGRNHPSPKPITHCVSTAWHLAPSAPQGVLMLNFPIHSQELERLEIKVETLRNVTPG